MLNLLTINLVSFSIEMHNINRTTTIFNIRISDLISLVTKELDLNQSDATEPYHDKPENL
jgi:hypothetical protein